MEFIDLKSQQARIRDRLEEAIKRVLDHGKYIMGPEVQELESLLAKHVNTKYAITCSSGTDALLMALMALGVKQGDAVLTTPFTFVATAEVVCLLGATPIFVDIDKDTFNMDPELLEEAFERAQSKGLIPKAIMPVDIFGLPCDYEKIRNFAKEKGLFVVEDAAQSFGASLNGTKACALGDIGCTSFFPAKPLGCYGDGGAIFTDEASIKDILTSLRVHGQGTHKYENVRIGLNGRMDTIQAAILIEKLKIFQEELNMRQTVANRYIRLLNEFCPQVITQKVPNNTISAWAQFTVKFPSRTIRDKIAKGLSEKGIPTTIYYPIPLHLQKAFSHLGYRVGDFPISEDTCDKVLSLPMHPYLEEEDQLRIVAEIGDILKKTL